jgi:hypothetical protein
MAKTPKMSAADKKLLADWQIIWAAQREQLMKDPEYFIEEFVKIEDRDSTELAVPFALWDKQREALRVINHPKSKLIAVLKARQLGCSWLALSYAVWVVLHSGKSVLALSKTDEDAKELVRRVVFILRYLPPWLIEQSGVPIKGKIAFDYMQSSVTVFHPNAEPSTFKSFPAGQNSGAGFTGNLLILDEWALQQYAREIWRAAFPTINRPTGGKVIGISTIRLGTLFEEIVKGALAKTNDFKLIFWAWNTDPRRDKEWYEKTRRNMSEEEFKQEYPATIQECLEGAGGKFFTELRADVHLVEPMDNIPDYYKRYCSIDYGGDATAVLWYYIDFKGYARVYKELFESGLIVSEAAEKIKLITGRDRIEATFAPDDLWSSQTTSGKSAANLFAEHGVYLTKTARDRKSGWLNVREWLKVHEVKEIDGNVFKTARLTIDKGGAPNLWRCMNAILSKKDEPRDAASEPHDLTHLPDSLRAFCVFWQNPSTQPKQAEMQGFQGVIAKELKQLTHNNGRPTQIEYV